MTDTERRQVAAVLREVARIIAREAGYPGSANALYFAWRWQGLLGTVGNVAAEMRAAADRVEKGEL